jgi:hypothetical protein
VASWAPQKKAGHGMKPGKSSTFVIKTSINKVLIILINIYNVFGGSYFSRTQHIPKRA